MTEQESIAYCAGLFDGEGCISIGRYRKGRNGYAKLQIIVVQKRTDCIDFLIKVFGGNRRMVQRRNGKDIYWRWVLWANKSVEFLSKLLPYLIEKKDQAVLAIEFQQMCDSQAISFTQNGKPGRPGFSPEIHIIRNKYADKLSQLKRLTVAETKRENSQLSELTLEECDSPI